MRGETETPTHDEQPTHAQIVENDFIADVRSALEAWREAGKPHKR